MYSRTALEKIATIVKKINFIQTIVEEKGGELEILSNFEKQDTKGSYDLRTFIAHNYEGVDLYIVEDVINERLPVMLKSITKILKHP